MRLRHTDLLLLAMLASTLSFAAFPAAAQSDPTSITASNDTGVSPYETYWGTKEDINLATGNVHLVVPILSLLGRGGHNVVLNAVYDSKVWQLNRYLNQTTDQYYYRWNWERRPPGSMLGWQLFFPNLVNFEKDPTSTVACLSYLVELPDGTKHNFPSVTTNCSNLNTGQPAYSFDHYIGESKDTSFLRLDTSSGNLGIVSLKNGMKLYFPGSAPGGTPSKIEDTNGNLITFTTNISGNVTSISDTLGRQVTFGYSSGLLTTVSYFDSNGILRTITLNYTTSAISATFVNPPGATGTTSFSSPLLTSIALPNGLSWSFQYNNFGELIRVNYPSGGYTRYDYGVFTYDAYGVATDFREVTAKHVCRQAVGSSGTCASEDTTTFQPSITSAQLNNTQNIVIDPLGNQTIVSFVTPSGAILNSEASRTIYQGTTTVLRTVHTSATTSTGLSFPFPTARTTILDDGQQSQIQWDYDTYVPPGGLSAVPIDNVIEQREYSYGAGTPGPLVRRTDYTWLKTNPVNGQDYTSTPIHIMDRKASEIIYDGAGTLVAQTQFEYDNFTAGLTASGAVQHDSAYGTGYTTRGNLTATSRWRNTDGAWLATRNQYDDAGNTRQSTDPGGHTTTFSYVDSWGNTTCTPSGGNGAAYRTSTTNALGQVTRSTYNSCTGTMASATDPNNQTTTFAYDAMNRLIQTNLPDGGQVTRTYNEASLPLSLNTTTKITGSLNLVATAVVDGLGRVTQTQLNSDPDGTVYADTTYDALGRKSTVSNPYRSTSDSSYGTTSYQYDALGRVTKVIPPDGAATSNNVTTVFSGNCTTVTDQAGKMRKSCSDALGRLVQVFEPDAAGNFIYETDYQYDLLDNLIRVDQKGNTIDSTQWRTRTFTYDSLSRLLSTANPESGTITFTYDADGNLLTKVVPQQNQTNPAVTTTLSYCYDALHRLTSKAYSSQSCPMTAPVARYFYDQANYNGLVITNGIGRRTGMSDPAGAEAWSFDSMGRPLTNQRTTNGLTKSTVYTYNVDGSVATLTYPSGRTITYTPGGAGRPLSAADSANSINYATNGHYAPAGALAAMQNGANLNSTYVYNNRLQQCWMYTTTSTALPWNSTSCTSTAATANILDLKYDFGLGVADNGNVNGIVNNRDTTRSLSFTYDQLNRIATAKTSSTTGQTCWGETFTYDLWANLLSIGGAQGYSGCIQEMLSITVTPQNQISGDTYDAAGNLTATPAPGSASYAYNAENQMTNANGTGYVYDGDGRRVEKLNSSGQAYKLYCYGMSGDVVDETDGTGSTTNSSFNEYVYFAGKRIARRDSSNNVFHYFADHLGTSRIMVQAGQTTACYDADFYPFGGERKYLDTCSQNYKFTGKERDVESGLDNFGARYNSSGLGRFTSPDPKTLSVRHLVNPQKWNKYAYTINNPLRYFDPNGMEEIEFQLRAVIQARSRPDPFLRTFAGDNRSFSTAPDASSRTSITVRIETDPSKRADPKNPIISTTVTVGETKQLDAKGNVIKTAFATAGLPTATASDVNGKVVINFQQDTKNPLEPQSATPGIRTNLDVTTNGSFVTTAGTVSGSPSFELNVSTEGGSPVNIPLQSEPLGNLNFDIGLFRDNLIFNLRALPPPPPDCTITSSRNKRC